MNGIDHAVVVADVKFSSDSKIIMTRLVLHLIRMLATMTFALAKAPLELLLGQST